MAESSPFDWQKPEPSGDPSDGNSVVFGFRQETMLEDLERFFTLIKRCGLKWRCLHADILDGFHGAHYELSFDGAVIDAPELAAGTGITIGVTGSTVTISASNNGDVTGPGSSTDNGIARFHETTGKIIQNSGVTIDDSDNVNTAGSVTSGKEIVSTGTSQGIGYATGAGGTVTQNDSKSNGVTLDRVTGQITMNNAELAAGDSVMFVVASGAVSATDLPYPIHASGGTAGAYEIDVVAVANGSYTLRVTNVSGGNLSEAIVIGVALTKGVTS